MGSPANISANVGQVGGQPLTPADVSAYLTQLGGSLNNFAGSLSNVLNYLLTQGIFTQRAVAVGYLAQNLTPATGTAMCGMAQNGVGSIITPASTGRILIFAVVTNDLNVTSGANNQVSCEGVLCAGKGTTGPAYGQAVSVGTGPIGPGFEAPNRTTLTTGFDNFTNQQQTPGTSIINCGYTFAIISGIDKAQPVWVDVMCNIGGTPNPTLLGGGGTFCVVMEY